jgi:hypothetical protein
MGFPFDQNLNRIQQRLENWWNFGHQKQPCYLINLAPPAGSAIPDTDDLERWWMDIDFIIDHRMKVLDAQRYYGVAVPHHYVDRGSSAMEGILGANMKFIDKETIWAYPCFDSAEQAADVAADPNNIWRRSTLEITRRSVALAKNHHYVAPYAMEGVSDILSGLYGTENLLVDMAEKPAAVERALERIKHIWIELWGEIQSILAGTGNRGGCGWAGIWAPGSTFPMQEDFSYMISARMFRRYCIPHIADMLAVMDYGFYHLDGVGAIPHLEHLLKLDKLRAIQWVPGAGKEELGQWHELIALILAAGKSVEVFARPEEIEPLVKAVGARGLLINVTCTAEEASRLVEESGENA